MWFKKSNKDNYDELTKKLAERSAEVARIIKKKMIELDIQNDFEFEDGEFEDGKLVFYYGLIEYITIRVEKVEVWGKPIEYLAILCTEHDDNGKAVEFWKSLEHLNLTLCWNGEPDVEIDGASNKEAITFLNCANEIYDYLSKLKERRAKERAKENAMKKKREISEIKKVIKKTDFLCG